MISPWAPIVLSEIGLQAMKAPPVATVPAGKPRINAAIIRAAREDGRDLYVFATAMMERGLDSWLAQRRKGQS
jgi:hypothetical protein